MNVMRGQPPQGQMGIIGNNIQGAGMGLNFDQRTDASTSK